MAVDRERVYQALRNLDSERALRNLLERELGYDYEGVSISVDDLPEDVVGALGGNPKLFASTANEGRFTVIYVRLRTPNRLSIMTERKIMERLKKSYPYSLFIFSDAGDKLWHFVNAPLAPEAQGPGYLSGRKQYRRIVVGPGERFRTATERISLLSVDDLAENADREPDDHAPLAVHAAHDNAFDVEEVTKEFFREYRRVFENVEGNVIGLEDEEDRRYFVQRLFNRLMFIAFIEKKGWMSLRGRTDYLAALWDAYASGDDGQGFYRLRLKPLFFQGFNAQDKDREDPIIGVVPYLNGGLFEEDQGDRDDTIDVPDRCLDEIINFDLHWNPVRLIQRFGRIDRIGTTYDEIYGYNFLPETGIEEHLGLKEKLQQRIREIQETIGEDGKILDPSEQVNHEALYAIYGADEDGQGSLALFDEDGDEDDDLVDLGEAIEMFRQMREEDREEFHRIATLRDGIRAARKRPPGSDGGGRAYVFCRAGEHRRFYEVDHSGDAKEISTQGFLAALRCEPTEKGLEPFPAGHNADVLAAKKSFARHLERVRAQQAGQSELPRGQRYALKELRKLYGQLGSEDRRERIERLEEVFRFETNMAARRELNAIHRAKLTGDELIEALEKLYTKYRLGESRSDSRELRRRAEADLIPRIVVSEAMGRP